jgi:hypothetical protein
MRLRSMWIAAAAAGALAVALIGVVGAGAQGSGGGSKALFAVMSGQKEVSANPGKYYVNVHNADFPGGAVRGQLFGKRR